MLHLQGGARPEDPPAVSAAPAPGAAPGLPAVTLRKDLAHAVRGGHPWLYRDALRCPPGLRSGDTVDVRDGHGAFLARGRYDAASPIAVRVYTLDPAEAVDAALLQRRLRAALRLRRVALDLTQTTGFRLCNGEGDGLPGVVVDIYHDIAVLRFDDEAAAAWRAPLAAAVQALPDLPITTVLERSRGAQGALLAGPAPADEVEIREHGTPLLVDVRHGQKTGLFLDQRENRRLIRRYAAGRSVLNCFSYTGGFSIQAALGGASQVVSVDVAQAALATARRIFARSGLAPSPLGLAEGAYQFLAEDVFIHLRRAAACGVRHDLVIVDPPSFAPSERTLPRALAAYRDLFALAMQVVAPGGLLAAASCSSHVDLPAFLDALAEASRAAGRTARILESTGQPADHPTTPAFKEGRYLKFVLSGLD